MMVQRNDLGDGKCMCMIAALPCGTRPGKGPRSRGERAHGGADGAEHSLSDFAWGASAGFGTDAFGESVG